MSEPNFNHKIFCGYGTSNGKAGKNVYINYVDEDDNVCYLYIGDTYIGYQRLVYMKMCDMYDQGMNLEAIKMYFDL